MNMVRTPLAAAIITLILPILVCAKGNLELGSQSSISMYSGQVKIIPTNTIRRVAVGNGKILSVTLVDGKELLLLAEGSGETNLHLWYKNGGENAARVVIAPKDVGRAAEEISGLLEKTPNTLVHVVGDKVIIDGKNLSEEDLNRIEKLRSAYPNVINLAEKEPLRMEKVVLLDVRILKLKKDFFRSLGVNWNQSVAGPQAGIVGDFSSNPYFRMGIPTGNGTGGPSANFSFPSSGLSDLPMKVAPFATNFGVITSVASRINFALQNGDAYEIANPKLSAKSGSKEPAEFLAGGQIPIPLAIGFGQTSVIFKDFGIRLKFSPVADDRNNVGLKIFTEISNIDPSITVGGVPGFFTSRTRAEINLKDGETLVMSGLVDHSIAKNSNKIPGLGNIPILGYLFRSEDFRDNESDLVFLVTPKVITAGSLENINGESHARYLENMYKRNSDQGIIR
ncbi:type II and III secretion system protein family protein [Acidithiobacillus ferrianus]|uniref:type II and III secretion system protein family protein n=1 Tax=Acidithiobacillus ferrianus TaxID=2678518 RepID=UPI0034E4CB3C